MFFPASCAMVVRGMSVEMCKSLFYFILNQQFECLVRLESRVLSERYTIANHVA